MFHLSIRTCRMPGIGVGGQCSHGESVAHKGNNTFTKGIFIVQDEQEMVPKLQSTLFF